MCSVIMQPTAIPKRTNYLHEISSNSKLRCARGLPPSPSPSPCSLQLSDHNGHIQTGRRSGGYPPAIWDFHYIQALNAEYKEEKHLMRAAGMIAQVKMVLQEEMDSIRRLELIDDLRRLGISCHFDHEIVEIFNSKYSNNNVTERDLYSTALRFRLLRQHGFSVSQEVFDRFNNDNLGDDAKGLLQLYEASCLSTPGEESLEIAKEFATKFLRKKLDREIGDINLLSSIRLSLELPTHWRVQMPNARSFIDAYKRRPDMNPIVLELAKLNLNIVQAQFQQELQEASRWWESTGLVQELPFVRDRIVECYYWTTGVVERREHGYERIMLTKINALITTIDDMFDIYGTLEELQLFTTAIQRWDIESMEQLPHYMQLCYLALNNFVNEMAYHTLKDKGFNSIPYLRKADEVERGDVPKSVQCYMNENNASEEEAREHVRSLIDQTWKTMNKEMMTSSFSKYFVQVAANLARMAQCIYQHEFDGFGMQHSLVNKMLRGLLFHRYE
uniref:Monoterpene synthase 13 n=1 Tax=Salvia officinalis TaxID=38868 RepID=A0A6M6CA16_SALOF|nr:monoterpene synthase 13 [Salvia officinalis]